MKRATGGRRERQTVKNKLSRLQSWKNSGRNRTGSKRAGAVPFFQRKTDKPRVKFRAGRWNTRIVAFLTRSVVVQHRENFFSSIDILLRGELEGKEERRSSRRRSSPPQRKRKTGWKGKREKDPGILWTGFSDLCLRPRLLFVFLLPAARRDRGGMEKGRMRRLKQKVFFPHCSRHSGIHTYVRGVPLHADISRKSHAGGKKKLSPPSFLPTTFVLPLPRIISSLYPPFRIGQTVHTHHFYSRVRPAFSF